MLAHAVSPLKGCVSHTGFLSVFPQRLTPMARGQEEIFDALFFRAAPSERREQISLLMQGSARYRVRTPDDACEAKEEG